jgi:hypothetical protein
MYKPEMCIDVSKVYKNISAFSSTEEGGNEKAWKIFLSEKMGM